MCTPSFYVRSVRRMMHCSFMGERQRGHKTPWYSYDPLLEQQNSNCLSSLVLSVPFVTMAAASAHKEVEESSQGSVRFD